MEKSWSQILNNFQTSIPIPFRHYSGGEICGYLSDYQHLSAPNCYQKYSIEIAIRIICAEIEKRHQ